MSSFVTVLLAAALGAASVCAASASTPVSLNVDTSSSSADAIAIVQTQYIYKTEDGGGEQQAFGSLLDSMVAAPQCSTDKFGINFCADWCNTKGVWDNCWSNSLAGADPRNTEKMEYTCNCGGCNGCAPRSEVGKPQLVEKVCIPKSVGGESLVADESFKQRVRTGIDDSRSKSVIFAGMLRDVTADGVKRLITHLKQLATAFARFHIIIVENNSNDDTRNGLEAECQGLGIWCFELDKSELGKKQDEHVPNRIQHLTTLRNLMIVKVHELSARSTEPWDSIIMFDGDIFGHGNEGFDVGATFAMLGRPTPAVVPDVVCANQLANWPAPGRYRDNFAIRNRDFTKRVEGNGSLSQEYFHGTDLMEVGSCFSGLSMFSMKAVVESKCDFQYVDEKTCEWVPFFQCLKDRGFGNAFLDPSWTVRMNDKGVVPEVCAAL